MESVLAQLLVFFVASVIAVPLAQRFKLGSVLGYLVAGMSIGPYGLSLIGDVEQTMHITEFGVVMMLFLVGLELRPSLLWQLRVPILGMGGAQVLATTLALAGIGLGLGLPWRQALALGLVGAMSSTAIVLQTLREKGQLTTAPGRSIFSVLLFQDLAVIPMLAILPLLAAGPVKTGGAGGAWFDITLLPGYQRVAIIVLAIASIYLVGKYASRPLFRTIAATRQREIFVGTALALLIGTSLLMTIVGLSPALGAFLAGVVLADSEYRHELESDIEPFKGLLLGIFFLSVGASINFTLIGEKLGAIGGLTAALVMTKLLVLLVIARLFKMDGKGRWLFAVGLAQGGEFAFVLFQFARVNGVLPPGLVETGVSVVALSMFLAPLLFLLWEKLSAASPAGESSERQGDEIARPPSRVILAGFGRLGTDVGRLLLSVGYTPIILDNDPANVDILRRFGFEVYYGDACRLDLLEAAGAAEARLMIIAIGDSEKALELARLAGKHYPRLRLAVSAVDRSSAYEFMDLGLTAIRRETFGSAMELGRDALEILGYDPYEAYRITRLFHKKDEENLPALYRIHRQDRNAYISTYRQHNADLGELMQKDREIHLDEVDRAWTSIRDDRQDTA
jgi:CPA2 family monovalent cation:H+ antiporter-2/glutathione-regulated potassium-efflux system ancillary protein KefC